MKSLLTVLILVASPFCFANEGREKKSRELMSLMKMTETLEKTIGQMSSFTDGLIDSQNLDEETKKGAKAIMEKTMESSMKEMMTLDWEGMFAEIYSEVFTEEELQGLIEFYKSPVGQKFLEKQPELAAATMQKMQGQMAKIMPKIQAAAKKAVEDAAE